MFVMTAPLPQILTAPAEAAPRTAEAPVQAPSRVRAFVSRCQTRYRLYRMCGWSRLAAIVTVLRRPA
jgi:hypothetical protein